MAHSDLELSKIIENLLVARNLRGMKNIQPALTAGYCLRAAQMLKNIKGTILIGTGFPVSDTFETDGPVGALILYKALSLLGADPVLVCCEKMAKLLANDYQVFALNSGDLAQAALQTQQALSYYRPQVVISIERPGLCANGCYHNMRGEDISTKAACFDYFMTQADCPTIAIGDGGNEIGMGKVKESLTEFDIIPAITSCDELIVADISNWGVYGILAFLSLWSKRDLLNETSPETILKYLSNLGSVDGVTQENTLTEDGLPVSEGMALIKKISALIGYENEGN